MICITDETRLTSADKCNQLVEFIDRLFEKFYLEADEIMQAELSEYEEEYLRIRNT